VEQLSLHDEFEASAVDTGAKGASAAKANSPDLVLMDVGLPDTDGREVVRSLRKGGFKAPIIMLTGHDTDSDTILGLESGANDYVAKPFRFAVLLARMPCLSSCLPCVKPGAARSMMNQEGPPGASASTVYRSASPPLLIHCLRPVSR